MLRDQKVFVDDPEVLFSKEVHLAIERETLINLSLVPEHQPPPIGGYGRVSAYEATTALRESWRKKSSVETKRQQ